MSWKRWGSFITAAKFGVTRNRAAEKESELTRPAYLDDCSDAPYCRGA